MQHQAKITDRIDSITGMTDEHRHTILKAPKSVKIELSPRCNFRCGFCALRTREKQPKDDMDLDMFKRITKEMYDAGVEEIGCFYLGESMMAPELLVKAITYLKQELKMPYVFLTSNASLATPAVVKQLMEAGLDSLKWSVNAGDEDQFKDIMGVKTNLMHDSLMNIEAAWTVRETGNYATNLYASSIQYDGEQADKMESLLDKHVRPFVDEHYFLPLYGMAVASKHIKEELGYVPNHGNVGRVGAIRKPIPCWSAFTEGHVRVDGGMSVCCFGADERFDVGNLNDKSFMDLWNSEKFQEVRAAHLRAEKNGIGELAGTMCEVCIE